MLVQKCGLLSIMPNRPVRDKWDYPRKMERHFPIKPRQPIRNSSCHFLSFPNSLIRAKNRFVKNGTANFDRNIPTEISGPPPKVIPNIPVGRNRDGPFHLNSDRNFRNLWHNGKHPWTLTFQDQPTDGFFATVNQMFGGPSLYLRIGSLSSNDGTGNENVT